MNLKNFNVLLIIVLLCSSSALMAQSKSKMSKKSKEQAVDARSADEKEEDVEKDFAYVVMDFTGKNGRYRAEMMMPNSSASKIQSFESIAVQKEAVKASSNTAYPSEIDFLVAMKNMDMELIAVTQENGQSGPMKRFYFKKEFEVSK